MKTILKTTVVALVASLVFSLTGITAFGAPKANFTSDKFENFTLHTYASFDPMANVSFIVEGEHSLVVIEPQAFKGKVEEFTTYTNQLGKPIEKVLVSFHAAGLKVYPEQEKVITKSMAEFMQSDAAKGMLEYFDKAFQGAMDTQVVVFNEILEDRAAFTVDGVNYELEPTSLPGMPGVNIAIEDDVYYQHFAPAKGFHASQNQLKNKGSIDAALADAIKAKQAGYSLLLGSHGMGKAGVKDLDFQIRYLKTMKSIAVEAQTADEFLTKMNKEYPKCNGEEDLKVIASNFYK